ncbi:MAG: DoxX family protein [Thaumarchaeota archaeon]|nr:DoxX family protein [Nitrososphaerota archaeon]
MTATLDPLLPYAGYLALILRVWVGANFIIHARPKPGQGISQTAQYMKGLGVPVGATYAATALELVGGLFLILGLLVPIVGAFFVIFMVSAAIMKKRKMHADYIAPNKPSYEVDVLYLALALVLVFLGAGVFSLDGAIGL